MNLLPPDFRLRLETIFSQREMAEIDSTFHQTRRAISFRVNTLKSNPLSVESNLSYHNIAFTKIDFLENAYILDARHHESDLWKTESYKNGMFYIQGISSQIPVKYFSHTQQVLSPESPHTIFSQREKGSFKKLRILDACAAPGGKTSQLAARFPNAEIWAFEPQKIRFEKMKHNLEKLGVKNVTCIHASIESIQKYIPEADFFDMILVDAPCSGEGGILHKNTTFLENWSLTHIKKNYARQKAICDAVLPYLKTGGEMIYSTCTIAPEENEAVVHYLLSKYKELSLENIDFQENKYIKYKKGLKSFGKNIFRKEISEQTFRVIPSEFSEGFYIAKLRKC